MDSVSLLLPPEGSCPRLLVDLLQGWELRNFGSQESHPQKGDVTTPRQCLGRQEGYLPLWVAENSQHRDSEHNLCNSEQT